MWIDFTKGLGAPVGAVLAGSDVFIRQAGRLKQQFGGAMRQSGIIAAMCLYALDHHVDRLADDHQLAAQLGQDIATLPQVRSVLPVETNIVIFDMADEAPLAADMVARLADDGILAGEFGARRLRLVTHLDVDRAAGAALIDSLRRHLGGTSNSLTS